jgi:hypothetical protein
MPVPKEVEALILRARQQEAAQAACPHSFRQVFSRIVPGTFAWKCDLCGQMRQQDQRASGLVNQPVAGKGGG